MKVESTWEVLVFTLQRVSPFPHGSVRTSPYLWSFRRHSPTCIDIPLAVN